MLRDGKPGGLYVERVQGEATQQSFRDLTGSDAEYDAWREFYADVADLADVVAPTLLEPLPLERDVARAGRHGHLARPGRAAPGRDHRASGSPTTPSAESSPPTP